MKIDFPDNQEKGANLAQLTERFRGMKTAQIIALIRENDGYTLQEISAILAHPLGTIRNWSTGRNSPSEATRFRIIETFSDPKVQPPSKVLRTIKETHHMHWEKERGWTVRITLTLNNKFVGKRRKIRLRTHNLDEAVKRREIAIACFTNLGFKIANRIQRRVKK